MKVIAWKDIGCSLGFTASIHDSRQPSLDSTLRLTLAKRQELSVESLSPEVKTLDGLASRP